MEKARGSWAEAALALPLLASRAGKGDLRGCSQIRPAGVGLAGGGGATGLV